MQPPLHCVFFFFGGGGRGGAPRLDEMMQRTLHIIYVFGRSCICMESYFLLPQTRLLLLVPF